MKELELLRAFTDIDDSYIDEAVPDLRVLPKKKPLPLMRWLGYAAAAACGVMVIGVGVFVAKYQTQADIVSGTGVTTAAPVTEQTPETSETGLVMAGNPFEYFDTPEQASQAAGFDISVPDTIGSFTERSVAVISGETIDITYSDASGKQICIRKARGSEDISGDYNNYPDVSEKAVNGVTVTFKGENDRIMLAVWTDGGFSYSAAFPEEGFESGEAENVIKQVK